MRDVLRRLDGTPDDSATGRAIRDTEAVMRVTMDVVPNELLNRNEATTGTSKFFIAGVAIAYSLKHGVRSDDVGAMAAVVRCTFRQWSSARAADYMADHLGAYMIDEDRAGLLVRTKAHLSGGVRLARMPTTKRRNSWRLVRRADGLEETVHGRCAYGGTACVPYESPVRPARAAFERRWNAARTYDRLLPDALLGMPALICAALSAEIGLKALLFAAGGNPGRA